MKTNELRDVGIDMSLKVVDAGAIVRGALALVNERQGGRGPAVSDSVQGYAIARLLEEAVDRLDGIADDLREIRPPSLAKAA